MDTNKLTLTCGHCNTDQEQYAYDWMVCNTLLDDNVGGGLCCQVLCLNCADNVSIDCSEIARGEA